MMSDLFWSTIVAVASWVGAKLVAYVRQRFGSKASNALETAIQIGHQLVVTSPQSMTPDRLIVQLKGLFAIQLAKAGIFGLSREALQPSIDKAIATLVTEWYKLRGSIVPPPILSRLV